jgi:hypothetical protein
VKGTRSVFAERTGSGYFLDFHWNREELARYGLSVEEAQEVVSRAIGGENVTTTVEGRERYPVNVRYMRDFRGDAARLRLFCALLSFLYLRLTTTHRPSDLSFQPQVLDQLRRGFRAAGTARHRHGVLVRSALSGRLMPQVGFQKRDRPGLPSGEIQAS